ncbi:MAG TPA: hypothetical protein VMW04_04765 [Patescibacteria group bacterium]|nr:hypothetical protein [Patescibacteria group bacterium]
MESLSLSAVSKIEPLRASCPQEMAGRAVTVKAPRCVASAEHLIKPTE